MLGEQGERACDPAWGLRGEHGLQEHGRQQDTFAQAEVKENQGAVCRHSGWVTLEGGESVSDCGQAGEVNPHSAWASFRGQQGGPATVWSSDPVCAGGPVRVAAVGLWARDNEDLEWGWGAGGNDREGDKTSTT